MDLSVAPDIILGESERAEFGGIAKSNRLRWGGDWTNPLDPYHLELAPAQGFGTSSFYSAYQSYVNIFGEPNSYSAKDIGKHLRFSWDWWWTFEPRNRRRK